MSIDPIPYPSDFDQDQLAAHHEERRRRALRRLDAGDVLALIDDRIAAEPDPAQHPLYHLVAWHLERCLTPMDGGEFFDRCRQLVISAINTALDEAMSQED